jgi:pimeloyl-ACP methyl ester carboxylesterase
MNTPPFLMLSRTRRNGPGRVARLAVMAAALCLAAASCSRHAPPAASSPQANALSVKTCTVDGMTARCGTLIVPEDRLTGKGRTIPVRFVVLPATSPDRAPDPVVYFAGGPGDSAVDLIPGERSLLADLNVHRDLVFIEQRGTGSSNPLACPAFPGLADKAALRASVQSCLTRLHGDLRFYTTAMYADDVNQVLGDLRYATANFVGISYGTTAEQVFLLRHPAQVRTMTLISGTPLNVPLLERLPGNTQLALDHVFGLCQSQPACHQAFPHLAADWAALWTSLGKSPWLLPATQSPAKTPQRLDQDTLASVTYNALYDGTIGPIPVVVHILATATNKLAALASVTGALQAPGQTTQTGTAERMMRYAIECGEAWESRSPAALSDQQGSFYYQTALRVAQWYQYVCPLIPKSAAAGDQQLTKSRVPVLAFNGAYDPVEQPRNWAGAQEFLPGSRAITLPGQGHNTNASWGACAGPLTQTFVEQAGAAHLDTSCLSATPPPPFYLNLQGQTTGG